MNSENKENLSNYQLVKRKPSVCSISLHLRKFKITVDQFFLVTPVLQWFQLNFGAGNFRGRRPGTSALGMLLHLTAVNSRRAFLKRPENFSGPKTFRGSFRVNFSGPGKRFSKRPKTPRILTRVFRVVFSGLQRELDSDLLRT